MESTHKEKQVTEIYVFGSKIKFRLSKILKNYR